MIIEAKKKETLIIAIKQDKNAVYKVIAAKDSWGYNMNDFDFSRGQVLPEC